MKLKLKFHGPKMHSPSWHSHGEKYRLGEWGHMKFGAGKNGRLRVHVWTGWRERGRHKSDSDLVFVPKRIGELMRPEHSAKSAIAGNYNNPLKSRYG